MADRWIALCVCGCLILQAEAPCSFAESGRTVHELLVNNFNTCLPAFLCACGCDSACACCDLIDHDTLPLRCGHLHSACPRSLFSVYCHPSLFRLFPLLLLLPHILFSYQHPLLFCFGPTYLISLFPPSSLFWPHRSVILHRRDCFLSLSLSCSFFLNTPFHFRAEILQSFTRLLDFSLPDFLLCSVPPCSSGLWRKPLALSLPLLAVFLRSFIHCAASHLSLSPRNPFTLPLWPHQSLSAPAKAGHSSSASLHWTHRPPKSKGKWGLVGNICAQPDSFT